ncbi:hypothetical protein ACFSO7_23350 [Bacillus sp. CGMCC 1.16607]|uniref:hypothetical protein n=1 Tax=Bacillus sp. CGMCC 1.16607 TaxID=3351842 RepID=UPI003631DBAE
MNYRQFPNFPSGSSFPPSAPPGQFPPQQGFPFPGGQQGFPFPGGQQGFPGGGGGQSGAPTSPPPSFIPQQTSAQAFAVDPGGIRGCLFRNTYVWLNTGESFWYFPTFVGRTSVAGWRWSRRFGWVYFGINLRSIQSFQCF